MSKSTWKKYEAPPSLMQQEDEQKNMTVPPQAVTKFANLKIDELITESATTGDTATMSSWSFIKARNQEKILKRSLEEDFIEDFKDWLLGESEFNVVYFNEETLQNKAQGANLPRLCTPWGKKPLTFIPTVKDFLSTIQDRRTDTIRRLSMLRLYGPRDINEAWLYYKYLVRGIALDERGLTELKMIELDDQGVDSFDINNKPKWRDEKEQKQDTTTVPPVKDDTWDQNRHDEAYDICVKEVKLGTFPDRLYWRRLTPVERTLLLYRYRRAVTLAAQVPLPGGPAGAKRYQPPINQVNPQPGSAPNSPKQGRKSAPTTPKSTRRSSHSGRSHVFNIPPPQQINLAPAIVNRVIMPNSFNIPGMVTGAELLSVSQDQSKLILSKVNDNHVLIKEFIDSLKEQQKNDSEFLKVQMATLRGDLRRHVTSERIELYDSIKSAFTVSTEDGKPALIAGDSEKLTEILDYLKSTVGPEIKEVKTGTEKVKVLVEEDQKKFARLTDEEKKKILLGIEAISEENQLQTEALIKTGKVIKGVKTGVDESLSKSKLTLDKSLEQLLKDFTNGAKNIDTSEIESKIIDLKQFIKDLPVQSGQAAPTVAAFKVLLDDQVTKFNEKLNEFSTGDMAAALDKTKKTIKADFESALQEHLTQKLTPEINTALAGKAEPISEEKLLRIIRKELDPETKTKKEILNSLKKTQRLVTSLSQKNEPIKDLLKDALKEFSPKTNVDTMSKAELQQAFSKLVPAQTEKSELREIISEELQKSPLFQNAASVSDAVNNGAGISDALRGQVDALQRERDMLAESLKQANESRERLLAEGNTQISGRDNMIQQLQEKEKQMSQFIAQNEQALIQIQAFEKEVNEKKEYILNNEQRVKQLEGQLQNLQNQSETLQEDLRKQKENNMLTSNELQQKISLLEKEKSQYDINIDAHVGKIGALEQRINQANADLEALKNVRLENAQLESELQKKIKIANEAINSEASKTKALVALLSDKENMQKANVQLQSQLAEANRKVQENENAVAGLSSGVEKTQEELNALRDVSVARQEEITRLKTQVSELDKSLAEKDKEIKQMDANMTEMLKKNKSMTEDDKKVVGNLRMQIDILKKDKEKLRDDYVATNKQKTTLEMERSEEKSKIETLTKENQRLQIQLKDAEANLEISRTRSNSFFQTDTDSVQLGRLQAQVRALENQKRQLQETVAEYSRKQAGAEAQLRDLEERRRNAERPVVQGDGEDTSQFEETMRRLEFDNQDITTYTALSTEVMFSKHYVNFEERMKHGGALAMKAIDKVLSKANADDLRDPAGFAYDIFNDYVRSSREMNKREIQSMGGGVTAAQKRKSIEDEITSGMGEYGQVRTHLNQKIKDLQEEYLDAIPVMEQQGGKPQHLSEAARARGEAIFQEYVKNNNVRNVGDPLRISKNHPESIKIFSALSKLSPDSLKLTADKLGMSEMKNSIAYSHYLVNSVKALSNNPDYLLPQTGLKAGTFDTSKAPALKYRKVVNDMNKQVSAEIEKAEEETGESIKYNKKLHPAPAVIKSRTDMYGNKVKSGEPGIVFSNAVLRNKDKHGFEAVLAASIGRKMFEEYYGRKPADKAGKEYNSTYLDYVQKAVSGHVNESTMKHDLVQLDAYKVMLNEPKKTSVFSFMKSGVGFAKNIIENALPFGHSDFGKSIPANERDMDIVYSNPIKGARGGKSYVKLTEGPLDKQIGKRRFGEVFV